MKSLFDLCVSVACENIESHTDMENYLDDFLPAPLCSKLMNHHAKNCLWITLNYIKIAPSIYNVYKERCCYDCVSELHKEVGSWSNIAYRPFNITEQISMYGPSWEKMKNNYVCNYCWTSLVVHIEQSCEC